jgi:hypothetical protein
MRGIAPLKVLLIVLAHVAAWVAFAARADEIEVREARLAVAEDSIVLDAEFAFDFNPRLAEAVANGVPLYFVVEFELTRPRWWWFDEKAAAKRLQLRLSYHAMSRQYRLSTGLLQQNFTTLEEALNVLRRVRGWQVVERTAALADAPYEAAVRMRLDVALLPKPFQLSALTSRELNLESPWRRFSYRPPPPAPAPVESREPPREAEAK